MIAVDSKHGPGLVGILNPDIARYPSFYWNLMKVLVPSGSTYKAVTGNAVAANRNLVLNELPDDAQWVWFMDDDHNFKPDLLMRLLDRNVDIVQPLVSVRKPPYAPYAYRRDKNFDGFNYITPQWSEIPLTGISEWDAVGTGGMLIRRPVLDALGYPWFEEGKTHLGDMLGEDLYFCTKAKEEGFRCWVDSDNRMGHISIHTVWPNHHPNGKEWLVDLDLGHNIIIGVPQHAWADAAYEEIKPHLKAVSGS